MREMILYSERLLKRILMITAVVFVFCYFAVAQGQYYSWDFSDCELKDILYAVSLDSGISIVADDTVSGKGDLKFAGKDFSAAFEAFLSRNRLFVEKGDVWIVSRFALQQKEGLFYIDAYDMLPSQILEKISGGIDSVLTFDTLPSQKITVHFKGVSDSLLMESLAKRFGNYEVAKTENGFHFYKKIESRRLEDNEGFLRLEKKENGFLVDVRDCRFSEIMEKLFSTANQDGTVGNFCMLSAGDTKLQRSVFYGLDFTDTLTKLCAQAGYSFVIDGDLFYIFADGKIKNELISGSRKWKKYTLQNTKTQDFFTLLSKTMGKMEMLSLPHENGFLCYSSESESKEIQNLITVTDVCDTQFYIQLKYIKPADFLNRLPQDYNKNSFSVADEDSSLIFKGTETAYKNLMNQIAVCDIPQKALKYDLLILQYDESVQNSWGVNLSAGSLKKGNRNSASAILGSVTKFNLNVISVFGMDFAIDLQNSIEENKTKVFADTTLYGVSGKKINFQNTNTYRYRENSINPDTGKPVYEGITREIISGIKLDVSGWVSGNGMITSTVTASVSRQGSDSSASTGNPPPTSEKIVTTEVCGRSGEPVILSGLVQNAESSQEKRTPLISKIPLFGSLFSSRNKTKESVQMVIYLVPHIDGEAVALNQVNIDSEWCKKRKQNFLEKINIAEEEKKLCTTSN